MEQRTLELRAAAAGLRLYQCKWWQFRKMIRCLLELRRLKKNL